MQNKTEIIEIPNLTRRPEKVDRKEILNYTKGLLIGTGVIIGATFIIYSFYSISNFYIKNHDFKWSLPITVKVEVKKHKILEIKVKEQLKSEVKINTIVKPVQAVEIKQLCNDPISCIRNVGEELGVDNTSIQTMIRIAGKEAICNTKNVDSCIANNGVKGLGIDPLARNPKSTAKGIFQILDGTWKHYKCTGDVFNIEDNTRCAYRILNGYEKAKGQGFNAWEVCKTSVNCLSN